MLSPDLHLGAAATAQRIGAAAPMQRLGAGGAAFGRLLDSLGNEVRSEVGRFIEQGGGDAPGLSPEGLAQRLQSTPLASRADAAQAPTPAALGPQQQAWLREIAPLARAAGARLGVAGDVLAAHAALETGWGQRPIRADDGGDSHNLFALKTGGGWRGEVAQVMTTEYEQGEAVRRREGFRSYASAGAAFDDFTRLLLASPRYRQALNTGSDVQAYGAALQDGGYATDPAYADKLAEVAALIRGGRR